MKKFMLGLTLCLALSLITSCGRNTVKPTTSFEELDKSSDFTEYQLDPLILSASNLVGYELLKEIFKKKSSENLLISSISLSFALAMLENGAAGTTKEGILKTMSIEEENMNTTYNGLLNYYGKNYEKGKKEDKGSTIDFANSLWFREDLQVKQPFVDTMKRYYDAQVYRVDFAKSDTLDEMNDWVEDQTNHLLMGTFTELDPATVSVLMNTTYFKGYWQEEFADYATQDKPFYITPDTTTPAPTMISTRTVNYYEDDTCQVAALDYVDATMYVILPKTSLSDFITTTSYDSLQNMINNSSERHQKLDIEFPKFKYDSNNTLVEYLKAMGMADAFSPEKADFSSMVQIEGENVFVSDVFQNTTIAVDETGTEADAVTVIEMDTTSAAPSEETSIPFICNHPFLYIIKDNASNTDLFIGIVENPVK